MPVAKPVTFYSKHRELRLLRKPAYRKVYDGGVVEELPEHVTEFHSHHVEVQPGHDLLEDGPAAEKTGKPVKQDTIAWMRSHPELGTTFEEVVAVAPDPAPLLSAITDALIARDRDQLRLLGDEEAASWNRPEILAQIKQAILSIPVGPQSDGPVAA